VDGESHRCCVSCAHLENQEQYVPEEPSSIPGVQRSAAEARAGAREGARIAPVRCTLITMWAIRVLA